jgi:hypothetical protein
MNVRSSDMQQTTAGWGTCNQSASRGLWSMITRWLAVICPRCCSGDEQPKQCTQHQMKGLGYVARSAVERPPWHAIWPDRKILIAIWSARVIRRRNTSSQGRKGDIKRVGVRAELLRCSLWHPFLQHSDMAGKVRPIRPRLLHHWCWSCIHGSPFS